MATFKEIATPDADDPEPPEGELPAGVKEIVIAAIGMLAVLVIPYSLRADLCVELPKGHADADAMALADGDAPQAGDGAEEPKGSELCVADIRPWTRGDDLPFAGLFKTTPDEELTAGEESLLAETEGLAGDDAEASDTPRLSLVTPPVRTAPKTAPKPVKPADATGSAGADVSGPSTPDSADVGPTAADSTGSTDAAGGADAAAPPGPDKTAHPYKRIAIPAELYLGFKGRVEDPHGAMGPFFQKLADVALQKPGAVARVSHWGDSTIAADGMTSMARRLLQTTFGDAGRGFVAVETGSDWYFVKDVNYRRKGWSAKKIIGGAAKDGRYGIGGHAAIGWKGAYADFGTVDKGPVGRKVSKLRVFYRKGPKSGRFAVSVDDGSETETSTLADEYGDGVVTIEAPNDGPHSFRVKSTGGGGVRLYGVSLERDRPGVIYDMLGVVGARASRMLNFDPNHLAGQLKVSGTDLMVIHFGGNSLTSKGMSMRWYRERYEQVIALYRKAAPNKSCLVMTPIDHGERHRGRIRTKPDLLKMVVVQREVALKAGCAFFSIFEAMGGEGTMGRWYREKPSLVNGDYAHATKHGARVLGSLFFKSLMLSFRDWLAAYPAAGTEGDDAGTP